MVAPSALWKCFRKRSVRALMDVFLPSSKPRPSTPDSSPSPALTPDFGGVAGGFTEVTW